MSCYSEAWAEATRSWFLPCSRHGTLHTHKSVALATKLHRGRLQQTQKVSIQKCHPQLWACSHSRCHTHHHGLLSTVRGPSTPFVHTLALSVLCHETRRIGMTCCRLQNKHRYVSSGAEQTHTNKMDAAGEDSDCVLRLCPAHGNPQHKRAARGLKQSRRGARGRVCLMASCCKMRGAVKDMDAFCRPGIIDHHHHHCNALQQGTPDMVSTPAQPFHCSLYYCSTV